jgi:exodeoxyribonuclease VII large subunit
MAEPALFDDPGTLTVGEVSRRIDRALRREFPPQVWVRGEIHDLNRATSGHVYFRLVGEEASVPVVLWESDKQGVNAALRRAGNAVRMDDGTEVRIRASVGWYAKRGEVSLRMTGIDPAFTLGRLAEAREVLLRRLDAAGLLQAQQRLRVPEVPLRIAVVTSLGSAAHADVLEVLRVSGLGWSVLEIDARVQGVDAEMSLAAGLAAAAAAAPDVVLLVRGGGARTELAAFDAEHVARAIAGLAVPVVTGVGHETDTSVADLVAWRRQPTPTATAAWLVERVRAWCERRDAVFDRVLRAAAGATGRAALHVDRLAARVDAGARSQLRLAAARLDREQALVSAADPAVLLARGWSITRTAAGELVRAPDDAPPGTELVTAVAAGEVRSVVA